MKGCTRTTNVKRIQKRPLHRKTLKETRELVYKLVYSSFNCRYSYNFPKNGRMEEVEVRVSIGF